MDEPRQILRRALIVLTIIVGCYFVYTVAANILRASHLNSQLSKTTTRTQAKVQVDTVIPYLNRFSDDANVHAASLNGFFASPLLIQDIKRADPGLKIGLVPQDNRFLVNVIYVMPKSTADDLILEIVNVQGYRLATDLPLGGNAASQPIFIASVP